MVSSPTLLWARGGEEEGKIAVAENVSWVLVAVFPRFNMLNFHQLHIPCTSLRCESTHILHRSAGIFFSGVYQNLFELSVTE